MKIAIVSTEKRSLGGAGGVAKFNWYLQRAIGGDICYRDEVYNRGYDLIIADGYNINDFTGLKNVKLISVVHGSIKEFALRNNKMNDNTGPILWQQQAWNKPNVIKVAVSNSAKHYAEQHHGCRIDAVINNGIDQDLYIPREHNNIKPIILHCGNDYNKTNDGLLDKVILKLQDKFDFQYLDARIGEEPVKMARGDMFIHISRYEGNSNAVLEALSCNLPIIASKVGIFEYNILNKNVGVVLPWNSSLDEFCSGVEAVYKNIKTYMPREWILENATYAKFEKEWQDLIKRI